MDKSLEDILKENKANRGPRGRGRAANTRRAAPYSKDRSKVVGSHDGSKILISNLDYRVTEQDLRELFTKVGPVKRSILNYGPSGKSKGTGVIIFGNEKHGLQAQKKFDKVTLDGNYYFIIFRKTNEH